MTETLLAEAIKPNGNSASAKWIIASNRLPFKWNAEKEILVPSSGGLVTAISGIRSTQKMIWVGVAPDGVTEEIWNAHVPSNDEGRSYVPIFVDDDTYDKYYNQMCNNVLWPLLHYESNHVHFNESCYKAYVSVSQAFAKVMLGIADKGDLVWVHDFHLFLLPSLLKKAQKELRVGFFLHTPFPSSEIFRQLPVRTELLQSVLEADLVGFHDYSYLRHFSHTVSYILGLDSSALSIDRGGSTTQLGVFPVSIDTQHFRTQSTRADVRKRARKLRNEQRTDYLVLGVDRLDYIKGISLKLKAFREMLVMFPEMRGRVSLLQLAVPSRTDVPGYINLRAGVEQLVGEINGKFGRVNHVPVQYMFRSTSFDELMALYQIADLLLVTSKRDGMNLVALEYIAAQPQSNPGVVVLSEFAGASATLSYALPTNPWDIAGTAKNIQSGLTMKRQERMARHRSMMRFIENYTATDWANSFMRSLEDTDISNSNGAAKVLRVWPENNFAMSEVLGEFRGNKVVVMLDFDGTLVPIRSHPKDVVFEEETKKRLRAIVDHPKIEIVVASGRDRRFIAHQFEGLNVCIAAEHGARFYNRWRNRWQTLVRSGKESWYSRVIQIMSDYSARVPGSFIEKKVFCIVWHYRKSPSEFGEYQARRLRHNLTSVLAGQPVVVSHGKKIVEVRPVEANKGVFSNWYLDLATVRSDTPIVLAIGDDDTDEDMFSVVSNRGGKSIKVGWGETGAQYRLTDQEHVVLFLERLVDWLDKANAGGGG